MAYITLEEYAELYGQPTISEADFPVYASQASDLIDSITQYRICLLYTSTVCAD